MSEKGVPVAQIGWVSAVLGVRFAFLGRYLSDWAGALPVRADVLMDWASWRSFLTRFGKVGCLYDFNDIHVLLVMHGIAARETSQYGAQDSAFGLRPLVLTCCIITCARA